MAPSRKSAFTHLATRFRAFRSDIIRNPDFQRFAARMPALKWFSQAKANKLYALTTGFVHAQTLSACVTTGLLDQLANGPKPLATLALDLDLPVAALERLVQAAGDLGLLIELPDGNIALDDLGVVAQADQGITAMVAHHSLFYSDLLDPIKVLKRDGRNTNIAKLWAYSANPNKAGISNADAASYSELMRVSQAAVAREVIAAFSFSKHKTLVDIGGGTGAFVKQVSAHAPHLNLAVFDLPQVVAAGKTGNWTGRPITWHGGSFFDDPAPKGGDCYSLIRVLYDHDDDAALEILKNIRANMPPNASLVIAEPMGGQGNAQRLVSAYFTFYLAAMASGKCRSPDDHGALLAKAGFSKWRSVSTAQPLYTSLIVAKP